MSLDSNSQADADTSSSAGNDAPQPASSAADSSQTSADALMDTAEDTQGRDTGAHTEASRTADDGALDQAISEAPQSPRDSPPTAAETALDAATKSAESNAVGEGWKDAGAASKIASAITAVGVAWEVFSPFAGPVPAKPLLDEARHETTVSEQVVTPAAVVASFRDHLTEAEARAGLTNDVKNLDDWRAKQQADRTEALDEVPEEAESAVHSDPPDSVRDELDETLRTEPNLRSGP